MLQMFVLALSLYNTWNRGVFLLCKITNLLIYSYMYNYIKKHPETVVMEDNTEMSTLEVFREIAGLDESGKKLVNVETAFYGEIRAWFLDIYPEVKDQKDNIKKLLSAKKKAA